MMSAALDAAESASISLMTQEALGHSRESHRQSPSASATTSTRVRAHKGSNMGTVGHRTKAANWHNHMRKMVWSSVIINEL